MACDNPTHCVCPFYLGFTPTTHHTHARAHTHTHARTHTRAHLLYSVRPDTLSAAPPLTAVEFGFGVNTWLSDIRFEGFDISPTTGVIEPGDAAAIMISFSPLAIAFVSFR